MFFVMFVYLLVLWLSNLCETLEQRCTRAEILQQWHYECDWTYGKRMTSSVDYNRYCQLLKTIVQKYFSQEVELSVLLGPLPVTSFERAQGESDPEKVCLVVLMLYTYGLQYLMTPLISVSFVNSNPS
jgi:hypothetical protein